MQLGIYIQRFLNFPVAHRRLTHASIGLIQKALKLNLVKGITISKSDLSSPQLPEGLCDGCAQGKAHRRKHRRETRQMIPTKTRRSQELGGLIAVDFTGPFSPPAIVTGNTVVFGATDAASRYSWTFYGKHRTEDFVIECIQKIVDYLHSKGKRLIHYHADGGRELVSHRVLNLLRKLGSTWTFNAPYTRLKTTPYKNDHGARPRKERLHPFATQAYHPTSGNRPCPPSRI